MAQVKSRSKFLRKQPINRRVVIALLPCVIGSIYFFGMEPVPGALPAVLGGGFLFGVFFMATDPVSAPRTETAKIIYAIIIGVFTTIIRNFSIFNGGLMFSILIGNMFAPILDYSVKAYKNRKAAEGGS